MLEINQKQSHQKLNSRESLKSDMKTNRKIMNSLLKKMSQLKGSSIEEIKRFASDYLRENSSDITNLYDEEKNNCKEKQI